MYFNCIFARHFNLSDSAEYRFIILILLLKNNNDNYKITVYEWATQHKLLTIRRIAPYGHWKHERPNPLKRHWGTVTGVPEMLLHLISVPLIKLRQLKQIFLEKN